MRAPRKEALNVKEGKVVRFMKERSELGETNAGLPQGQGHKQDSSPGRHLSCISWFRGALKTLLGISSPRYAAAFFLGGEGG